MIDEARLEHIELLIKQITQNKTSWGIPRANNNGKIANAWLNTGSGNGFDADTVDGIHFSAWEAHVPTTGNLTIGNGSLTARNMVQGNTVHYAGKLICGSTTSITGLLTIVLPFQAANQGVDYVGSGWVLDAGSVLYTCSPYLAPNSTSLSNVAFYNNGTGGITATNPMTWATGDSFSWYLIYEAQSTSGVALPDLAQGASGVTAGFAQVTGNAVTDASTFTGGRGATGYTIGDVIAALKILDLLEE